MPVAASNKGASPSRGGLRRLGRRSGGAQNNPGMSDVAVLSLRLFLYALILLSRAYIVCLRRSEEFLGRFENIGKGSLGDTVADTSTLGPGRRFAGRDLLADDFDSDSDSSFNPSRPPSPPPDVSHRS